eukprot:730278-Pyramimonas_sp.AAC.1
MQPSKRGVERTSTGGGVDNEKKEESEDELQEQWQKKVTPAHRRLNQSQSRQPNRCSARH